MDFDHVVLVVNDLVTASHHFNRLGFTVRPGGEHRGWGTHNALIGLADGSYLELLAATRPWQARFYRLLGKTSALGFATNRRSPIHRRFIHHLAAGEGLADYALLSGDLKADLQAARTRGLELEDPLEGGRLRPDGQQVSWRTAVPASADLPFLIEDLTPRELRMPPGVGCWHPNGVTGVAALQVACRDLKRSVEQYRRLLGFPPETIEAGQNVSSSSACFRLERIDLILFPAGDRVAMRKRAATPQAISLRTSTGADPFTFRHSPKKGYFLDPA
jgi:hypothetical protein